MKRLKNIRLWICIPWIFVSFAFAALILFIIGIGRSFEIIGEEIIKISYSVDKIFSVIIQSRRVTDWILEGEK